MYKDVTKSAEKKKASAELETGVWERKPDWNLERIELTFR